MDLLILLALALGRAAAAEEEICHSASRLFERNLAWTCDASIKRYPIMSFGSDVENPGVPNILHAEMRPSNGDILICGSFGAGSMYNVAGGFVSSGIIVTSVHSEMKWTKRASDSYGSCLYPTCQYTEAEKVILICSFKDSVPAFITLRDPDTGYELVSKIIDDFANVEETTFAGGNLAFGGSSMFNSNSQDCSHNLADPTCATYTFHGGFLKIDSTTLNPDYYLALTIGDFGALAVYDVVSDGTDCFT